MQDNAEESVRRLLSRLEDGAFRVEMDQGTWVDVKITVDRANRRARVDFSDTSMEQRNNFNAPEPVTRAATLYVFRVMVNEPIPMNAGCLKPIDIVIPERSMLKPAYPAAVVAGNVETSQIVTNCLFAAMKAHGAQPGHHEQPHLRQRQVPVLRDHLLGQPGRPRLRRHGGRARAHDQHAPHRPRDPGAALSRAAGGVLASAAARAARASGAPATARCAASASWRRWTAPSCRASARCAPTAWKAARPGECGENWVRRNDGRMERLEGCDQTVLEPGEAVIIKTPTGGGFGKS